MSTKKIRIITGYRSDTPHILEEFTYEYEEPTPVPDTELTVYLKEHESHINDPVLEDIEKIIADGVDINHKGTYGNTALMEICGTVGSRELLLESQIVKLLIANGADVNLLDDSGESALFKACEWGNDKIIEILIENGADVFIKAKGYAYEKQSLIEKMETKKEYYKQKYFLMDSSSYSRSIRLVKEAMKQQKKSRKMQKLIENTVLTDCSFST